MKPMAPNANQNNGLPRPIPALVDLYRVRDPGSQIKDYVGLDRNERVQPLPEWFLERLRASMESALLTSYTITDDLYRKLSLKFDLPEEQFLLTTGSDAAIKALFHAYVRPGDKVVMLDPSYAMYEVYAQMFEAQVCKVSFNERLELDVQELLDSIVPGVRFVIIANPNQPTATVLSEEVLLQLAERTRAVNALLAVDEAYYPFHPHTIFPWIREIPNLLVTRTFSKAAGLAGLRVGMIGGHPEVIGNLFKVRSAHDVNSLAAMCASHILDCPQIVDDYVSQVKAGAQVLAERARDLGLVPLSTPTNFMLIRVAQRCSPAVLIEKLRSHGYIVKGPFGSPCLADCIRVTLGPPDVMIAFADTLQRALSEVAETGGK
jgi:histidinol-phosphate aminotransferase